MNVSSREKWPGKFAQIVHEQPRRISFRGRYSEEAMKAAILHSRW